ncbi:uncharacterized protein PG986_011623 [Apiospora aurea]|uniref:Uncharacterized protein n=1 Tax=Apiospora aurea TaxID=335848 RepID=A0ABR1PXP5_9PEZI
MEAQNPGSSLPQIITFSGTSTQTIAFKFDPPPSTNRLYHEPLGPSTFARAGGGPDGPVPVQQPRTNVHGNSRPHDIWTPSRMTEAEFQTVLERAMRGFYSQSPNSDFKVYKKRNVWVHHCASSNVGSKKRAKHNQSILQNALDKLLKRAPADELFIVYYGGHGANDKNSCRYWLPTCPETEVPPAVDFEAARRGHIDNVKPDVFMILDCCYSGSASVGSGKELLAAYNIDEETPGACYYSFTSCLIQQLQHFADCHQIMTTSQLYARLVGMTRWNPGGYRMLRRVPIHILPSDAPECRSTCRPSRPDELTDDPDCIKVRMVAYISDGSSKTMDSLKTWATKSRPPCVKRIKIESVEPSGSALVTFTIPVSVWANLCDHPGLKTIAILGAVKDIIIPPRVLGSNVNIPQWPAEKRHSLGGLENIRP